MSKSNPFRVSETYMLSLFHTFLLAPLKDHSFDTFYDIYLFAKKYDICFEYAMIKYLAKEGIEKDE